MNFGPSVNQVSMPDWMTSSDYREGAKQAFGLSQAQAENQDFELDHARAMHKYGYPYEVVMIFNVVDIELVASLPLHSLKQFQPQLGEKLENALSKDPSNQLGPSKKCDLKL